jgi:hypothetical protein
MRPLPPSLRPKSKSVDFNVDFKVVTRSAMLSCWPEHLKCLTGLCTLRSSCSCGSDSIKLFLSSPYHFCSSLPVNLLMVSLILNHAYGCERRAATKKKRPVQKKSKSD